MRMGLGYDVHAFSAAPERRLMLGGVEFPGEPGLAGHSDADVVTHAICDALLGAAALGDIGDHFPPGDPAWRDADSLMLLGRVVEMLGDRFTISNVDVTVIAELPLIGARRDEMRAALATAMGIDVGQVSVKATTNERLGAIGRSEGIAALAVALIEERA
mgnify:CR=1 FL=1